MEPSAARHILITATDGVKPVVTQAVVAQRVRTVVTFTLLSVNCQLKDRGVTEKVVHTCTFKSHQD